MSLHVAAAAGDVDAVCRFALAAADINFPNQQGLTAVFVGAREGHVNVLKQLHALRADMSRPNLNGATPLFVASRMGHLSAVQFLVSVGASVSQPSNDGWTPLHIASESGHLAVVKYLITQGASVTEPNHDGFSPLQIATNKGHLHVAAVLVAFGADPFVKNRNNFSAVDTAVKTHQSIVLDFFNGLKAGSSSALGLIGNAFLVLSADEEEISTNNLADVQRLLDAQIQKGENLELQLAFELGTKRAIEDDLAEEKYKTLALEATCHQLQTEVDEARATCQQLRAELDQALAARLQAERSKVFDLVKQGRELDIAAVSELAGYWKLALPADAFSGQVTVRSILGLFWALLYVNHFSSVRVLAVFTRGLSFLLLCLFLFLFRASCSLVSPCSRGFECQNAGRKTALLVRRCACAADLSTPSWRAPFCCSATCPRDHPFARDSTPGGLPGAAILVPAL
eukprot:m.142387 g.142387  ORF g.142387 m.142387 type:complete len:456 (+) comp52616_c0_seq9:80-1447(+)